MNGRSLFIVGCGRNGTSMAAGLFRNGGYFMGRALHNPSPENPTGYFEDAGINQLNNRIINRYLQAPISRDDVQYQCDSPVNHGWLARLPLTLEIEPTTEEDLSIREWVTMERRFCFKDTRFCYLLPLWRRHAPAARMICVFRSPDRAAASILHSCRTRPGLAGVAISVNQAFEIWTLMYSWILKRHSAAGEWLFVNYDDILTGSALPTIAAFAEAEIDEGFPQQSLNRTESGLTPPPEAIAVYDALRDMAATSNGNFS